MCDPEALFSLRFWRSVEITQALKTYNQKDKAQKSDQNRLAVAQLYILLDEVVADEWLTNPEYNSCDDWNSLYDTNFYHKALDLLFFGKRLFVFVVVLDRVARSEHQKRINPEHACYQPCAQCRRVHEDSDITATVVFVVDMVLEAIDNSLHKEGRKDKQHRDERAQGTGLAVTC